MAEVVAVEQIEPPFLAGRERQMRMGCASDGVGQEQNICGAQVQIGGSEIRLVEWGDPVGNRKTAGGGEFDDAVAVIRPAGVDVERSVAGGKEHVAAGVDG